MTKVKLDGKNWIAKGTPYNHLIIKDYASIVRIANKNLGEGGIVCAVNSRGMNHPFGPDFRYEKLRGFAKSYSPKNVINIDGRKLFYDSENKIYFVKAQEISANTKNSMVKLLAYNLPYGENLNEGNLNEVLRQAEYMNCILGITGPSCINNLEKVLDDYPDLLDSIDFFVSWSGVAKGKKANINSEKFYDEFIFDERDNIGEISVSGGHRPNSIGKNYTKIKTPSQENFMEDLRNSLREADLEYSKKNMLYSELLKHAVSTKIADPIRKIFRRFYEP